MIKSDSINLLTKLYAISIIIYIFRVYDVIWLYFMPVTFSLVLAIFFIVLKIIIDKLKLMPKDLAPFILLILYFLYEIVFCERNRGTEILQFVTMILTMTSIIMLSLNEKKYLLNLLTNVFVIVIIISLAGWILYLLGVNMAHSDIIYHKNGFHVYYNYYLFRVSVQTSDALFRRFSSIFLEPGQLATPCAFLFYLNTMEKKVFNWKNLVLLAAVLFSFSLIAYGLLLITFVSIAWYRGSRYRIIVTGVVFVLIGLFFYYFSSSEDNAVQSLILNRLEYDEESIISGNNRTSTFFDINYKEFIKTSDVYFGIHQRLMTEYDWTYDCSGIRKFVVHHGIVGTVIFFTLVLSLFWQNRNRESFIFLVILISAFVVRNLLQNPMWMAIAVLGFYTINKKENKALQQTDIVYT